MRWQHLQVQPRSAKHVRRLSTWLISSLLTTKSTTRHALDATTARAPSRWLQFSFLKHTYWYKDTHFCIDFMVSDALLFLFLLVMFISVPCFSYIIFVCAQLWIFLYGFLFLIRFGWSWWMDVYKWKKRKIEISFFCNYNLFDIWAWGYLLGCLAGLVSSSRWSSDVGM